MVELQSCASLVNASSLCVTEGGMKGESTNVIAEISAELERERQKNADLMQRILILEAQIQEKENEPPQTNGQVRLPFFVNWVVSWFFNLSMVLFDLFILIANITRIENQYLKAFYFSSSFFVFSSGEE